MSDKPLIPSPQPALPSTRPDTQWVMVFNLFIKTGKEEVKRTYKVNKKRLVIGSALSSDIRIQQNAVSNVHAVVEMDDKGNAEIFDMASETGLFVNDKKVVSQVLKDGDEVKIGFAALSFKKVAVAEASSAAPADTVRTTGSGRKLFYDAKEDFRPLILEDERNVIQIFDYPGSGELCLQVVMYWGDVILDVEHFVDNKPVTLGEDKKANFLVPGLHSGFELVSFDGPSANLMLTDEMKGVVRTGNRMSTLAELGTKRFQLRKDDLAKIQLKEVTFFVSYSPLPPHLRRQRVLERDPFWTRIFFSSLLLTGALCLALWTMVPTKPLDSEEVPPPLVVKIFQPIPPPPPPPVKKEPERKEPEKKVEPPKHEVKPPKPPKPPKKIVVKPRPQPPKVVPPKAKLPDKVKTTPHPVPQAANQVRGSKPKPGGGNQGAGAKAAGAEGQKGRPNAPKAALHQNDSRGNPSHTKPTKSQVQGNGNVEAMFSDLGGSISKSMAAGAAGAHAAGANLRGFGNKTTEGNGGLGQIGSGRGGGGASNNSQGLADHGLGEGLKGNGLGAIGSGGNLSGSGYGRPNIEVGNASETIVMGGLDKSVIDEYIRRHMPQLRACYERQLNSASGRLAGRIATRFVISGTGRVSQAGVTSSSIGNAKVEGCVLGVLRNIVFPEPLGGGVVEVDYPFSFTPAVGG
jgi:hypothetical protein